ncbi:zinc-ribbon domain-containing protein [Desulfofalx alkaliphila]|uniref:zinc-ribbon domain-containing protein n=1 Tax=Desulfofalx alkaliphila TaxID=105483 RepID=UPI0004E20036|nr:zinc-ribbon domain-containing protein [Desulfofalx alkaliphila]
MSFLKKITEQVTDISKKSQEMVGVTKLKLERSQIESQVNSSFKELGEQVFISYCNNNTDGDAVIIICEKIKKLKARIEEINQEIENIAPRETLCPNCEAKIMSNVHFCSKCGHKIKDDNASQEGVSGAEK